MDRRAVCKSLLGMGLFSPVLLSNSTDFFFVKEEHKNSLAELLHKYQAHPISITSVQRNGEHVEKIFNAPLRASGWSNQEITELVDWCFINEARTLKALAHRNSRFVPVIESIDFEKKAICMEFLGNSIADLQKFHRAGPLADGSPLLGEVLKMLNDYRDNEIFRLGMSANNNYLTPQGLKTSDFKFTFQRDPVFLERQIENIVTYGSKWIGRDNVFETRSCFYDFPKGIVDSLFDKYRHVAVRRSAGKITLDELYSRLTLSLTS